jgi:cell division inhibitor SulA
MPRTRKYNIQIWKPEKKIYEIEQIEEEAKNKLVDLLRFLNISFTVSWLRETSKSKKSSIKDANTKTTSGLRIRKPSRSALTPIDFIKPPSAEGTE